MAEYQLNFDGEKAKEFFDRIQRNVKDIRSAERAFVMSISALVFRDVMQHFENQEGSSGKWKPWSKIYAERMAKLGKGGNRILQDNGRLRQAFTPSRWRARSEGIEWFNPAKTSKGFPYAAAHDEGRGRLPKRDFMWLSQKGFERIAEITAAYMIGGRKGE